MDIMERAPPTLKLIYNIQMFNLRNLANEPREAWPCIITATATKKTSFPSSSSVVLFAQMMFADQVYRTRLRSFFTELFCEEYSCLFWRGVK
jgi:hypothetical protein